MSGPRAQEGGMGGFAAGGLRTGDRGVPGRASRAEPGTRAGRRLGAAIARMAPAAVLGLAVVGAWELYVDLGGVDQLVLPAPHAIAATLWEQAGPIWQNFTITAKEVVLGLALALAVGFVLAVAIHLFPLLRRAVYPWAVGSQAVPFVVLAPLLVFWWGFGLFPKLVVIALVCFFPVLVVTVDALASVDPDQLKLLRTLGASRAQAFRFAELPAALPAALSGARIALAVGVIGAYIAETSTPTVGPYAGLGHQVIAGINDFRSPYSWAATVVLFGFSVACFYSLALIERRVAPWAHRPQGGDAR